MELGAGRSLRSILKMLTTFRSQSLRYGCPLLGLCQPEFQGFNFAGQRSVLSGRVGREGMQIVSICLNQPVIALRGPARILWYRAITFLLGLLSWSLFS